jgi:hypothetical protein
MLSMVQDPEDPLGMLQLVGRCPEGGKTLFPLRQRDEALLLRVHLSECIFYSSARAAEEILDPL